MKKPATLITAFLLALLGLAHLLRIIFGINVTIGDWPAPTWVSVVGFIIPAALAVLLLIERRGK